MGLSAEAGWRCAGSGAATRSIPAGRIRHPVFRHVQERGVNLDGAAALMERRAIVAALLMAGLLILYQSFFAHTPEAPPPAPKEAPAAKPSIPSASGPVTPSPAPAAPVAVPVAAVPLKRVQVTAPLYKAQGSNHRGDLAAWDLDYRGIKPMIVPGLLGPRGITVERAGQPPLVVD